MPANVLDPTGAEDPTGVAVMRSIFDARVGPGLFDAEVVREYARRSVVIEHNHDGIWWEVAPMLWEWLDKA